MSCTADMEDAAEQLRVRIESRGMRVLVHRGAVRFDSLSEDADAYVALSGTPRPAEPVGNHRNAMVTFSHAAPLTRFHGSPTMGVVHMASRDLRDVLGLKPREAFDHILEVDERTDPDAMATGVVEWLLRQLGDPPPAEG